MGRWVKVCYDYGYRNLMEFPYKEAKRIIAEWDAWAKKTNPTISSIWIKLYRGLPFYCYWLTYKILNKVIKLRKKH